MYLFTWIWKCWWFSNFRQKPRIWEKSGSWVMVERPLDQWKCRIPLTEISHKRLEIWGWSFVCDCLFKFVQIYSVVLSLHGQACLDVAKVIPNSMSTSSREWIEL